jgi:hypothetical protein
MVPHASRAFPHRLSARPGRRSFQGAFENLNPFNPEPPSGPQEFPLDNPVFGSAGLIVIVFRPLQKSASSTMRYRALPARSRSNASLMRLIGKCSVWGVMP